MRRYLPYVLGGLAVLFLLIQLVPYRASNPPVRQEPDWDSPRTRELAVRACYDCHSNEMQVPIYGYVAPFAWLVRQHVDEARGRLNLSEMDLPQRDADEAAEEVRERKMPPWYYTPLHAKAQLSDAEWEELASGLEVTLGGEEH